MKEVTKDVKTKGKTVGQVTVNHYETVQELVENESEERILGMFNKQNLIRMMGNERAKHGEGRIGKQKRTKIAYGCLTLEEAASVAQDYDALQELLNSDEIQARVDAKLAEDAPAEAESAEEDDDDLDDDLDADD